MAIFNTSFLPSSDEVDVNKIYTTCLYRPTDFITDSEATATHTFEALNGGLTSKNISDAAKPYIESEVFRAGSFVRGYFYGFNFPDRFHSDQFSPSKDFLEDTTAGQDMDGISKSLFIKHYSLGANIFCPWKCVVYISFQGFFAGKATKYGDLAGWDFDDLHNDQGAQWFFQLYINGTEQSGSRLVLPETTGDDEKEPLEYRYRWHHRTLCVQMEKGYNEIDIRVWPKVLKTFGGPKPKHQTLCGSMSVLAIKSGSDSYLGGIPEFYSKEGPAYTSKTSSDTDN